MSAEALLDTNILVYAQDSGEPLKQMVAQTVLSRAGEEGCAAVCAQVLCEYMNVVTHKFVDVLDAEAAALQVARLASVLAVHPTTVDVVLEAARGVVRYGFSYYDAQIWAVARINNISVVISEDFAHGSVIEGVRFVNPFAEMDAT